MHMRVCMSGWLVVTLFVSVVDGILVLGPEDSLAVRGSNVSLQCVTNRSEPVQWEVYKEPPIYWRLIYTGYPPKIPDYLKPKYYVTIDSTDNEYNLTIKNIQYEDSGTYRCIDYYGLAPKEEDLLAEVTVVEERISCSERICKVNETGCVLEEEVVDITCVMRYSGKRRPVLYWSLISSSDSETQLPSYTTVSTGGWRSATLTSRLVINYIPHNSYIRCSLARRDSFNITFNNMDLDSIAEVYWRSNLIKETVKRRNIELASVLISVSVLLIIICSAVLVKRMGRRAKCYRTPVVDDESIPMRNEDEPDMKAVQFNNWIIGVTVVDDKLYVIQGDQSNVNVYDKHELRELYPLSISGLKEPGGLAGCSHNKALYVSDLESGCLNRVNLINNTRKVWLFRKNYSPRGLSVTLNNNLLASGASDTSKNRPSIIVEYTSQGFLIRVIELTSSFENIWQTVELRDDQFIFCHGWYDSLLHRICLVNDKGEIIDSYGSEAGGGMNKLNEPSSLVVDRDNKFIYAADYNNNRILKFNIDNDRITMIETKFLILPTRLCFDSQAKQLYAGDLTGRVCVISTAAIPIQARDNIPVKRPHNDLLSSPSEPTVSHVTNNSLVLTWTWSDENYIGAKTYFILEYREVGGEIWYKKCETSELTAKISYLKEGSTYEFRVIAFDHHGKSSPGPKSRPVCVADTNPLANLFKAKSILKIRETIILKAAMISALNGHRLYYVCKDWWNFIKAERKMKNWKCLRYQLNLLEALQAIAESLHGEVRGITIVDGKLFVVHSTHTDQVKVYDYKNFKLIHNVNIPDLRDPQGLAVCSYSKALYISDLELKYIHIHLLGTTGKVTPLSINNNMEPFGLSLTTEGILLVTVRIRSTRYEKGIPVTDNNKSKILGYKNLHTNPYIEFEIDLHESIEGAWHTIQLSKDCFVTCHGECLALVHRVCLVNREGNILRSFDGQRIYGTNKLSLLSRPCSLDIDKNRIVVASYFYGSIVILDHDLRYVGQMDCKKNFEYPSSLCLAPNNDDDDTSILLVGDSKGSVFRLPIKPQPTISRPAVV